MRQSARAMRILAAVTILVALSAGAWADDLSGQSLMTPAFILCAGLNACSQATDEHCAVALGTNTQFPPHASHVLVTPRGIWSLYRLDAMTVARIDRMAMRFGGRPLDQRYIDAWNQACGGVPVS
jgi:hypothetical protein